MRNAAAFPFNLSNEGERIAFAALLGDTGRPTLAAREELARAFAWLAREVAPHKERAARTEEEFRAERRALLEASAAGGLPRP